MMSWLLALIPVVALAYVMIIQPVADRVAPGAINSQVVWPLLFGLTLVLVLACRRHMNLKVLVRPPGLLLFAFLCYSAASVLWAFSQPDAFKRWVQAVMLVTVMIVPFAVKHPRFDIMIGVFWCLVVAMAVNGGFVLTTPPMLEWTGVELGHPGYFLHKQYLGMCASCAILVALYALAAGKRRMVRAGRKNLGTRVSHAVLGAVYSLATSKRGIISVVTIAAGVWLVLASRSKTALGFALIGPVMAYLAFAASRKLRLPMVAILVSIPVTYVALSALISDLGSRIAFRIYGDPTFTGRVFIWDFIETQSALKPWFGWGFHSFWFVASSPIESAPGFVRSMPSSHNGYLDLRLETGYVGLTIFLAFILSVLFALEHVRRVDSQRAFALVMLFVYVMIMNLLETIWFIPFDPLWVLFMLLTGETLRHESVASAARQPVSQPVRTHLYSHSRVAPIGRRPFT